MKKEKCLAIIVSLLVLFFASGCARLKDFKNQDQTLSISLSKKDIENIRRALGSNIYKPKDKMERVIEETSWISSEGLNLKVTTIFPLKIDVVGRMEIPEAERLIYIALNAQDEPGCRKALLKIDDTNGECILEGIILACKRDGAWQLEI